MIVGKLRAGTSQNFIRERQLLKRLPPHPNIIKLVEVCNQPHNSGLPDKYTEFMIFEFAEHELDSIRKTKIAFEESHVKCILK